ncbi:MAG: hypothetical protein ACOX4M_00150 [Acetivibrionales bacterium]|jgi:hypothetical protein
MFSLINKQFIFRLSGGEVWNFFYDDRQNLCLRTLSASGGWNNAIVLHRNVYRGFCADMDRDNACHLLFQDNSGNLHYSRFDGRSVKTAPVLKSRIPSAYDKHLYIAPLKNNIYFFYVLQHGNSFMLAYQVFGSTGMSTPKVVDYVSGSSLPCSLAYDSNGNLYAFYQSYDGKYLQLGYKKFNAPPRHWSDFTPVTKFQGNCEYPHVLVDTDGIIRLCYQRRSPRLFEMVYQQKNPGRNLWSPEVIVHSSVHPFKNASILETHGKIVIYWVRDNTIYFCSRPFSGGGWSRPSRYGTQSGRQLQCLCYKSNSPRDNWNEKAENTKAGFFSLAPGVFPGSTAYGLKLAFVDIDAPGSISALSSQLLSQGNSDAASAASFSNDDGSIVQEAFRSIQGSIAEIREGLSKAKREISRLANIYMELAKEVGKHGIRLNIIENRVKQAEKSGSGVRTAAFVNKNDMAEQTEEQKTGAGNGTILYDDEATNDKPPAQGKTSDLLPAAEVSAEKASVPAKQQNNAKAPEQKISYIDPDKMKQWEEWTGPKEWQEAE